MMCITTQLRIIFVAVFDFVVVVVFVDAFVDVIRVIFIVIVIK